MFRRLVSWVMAVTLGLAFSASLAPADAAESAEAAIVKKTAQAVLEARWSTMMPGYDQLAQFYDTTLSEAAANLAKVESVMHRHYREPAAEAGFEYTSVKVFPEFTKVAVSGDTATVEALVAVDYTSVYSGSTEEVLTKEANIPYYLRFTKKGNNWYLVSLEAEDTFSKQPLKTDREYPSLDETDLFGLADESSPSDVGARWYHYYDRAAAVAYANQWWDGRNPAYKSFSQDCANFVSQSFRAGLALEAKTGPFVWWYDNKGTSKISDDTNSTSWSVAQDQTYSLSRITAVDEHRGRYVNSATELAVGDSIYYDIDGDGLFDHSAIVVSIKSGQPHVSYHTNDTKDRHWNLGYPITKFLKITDFYWLS